MQPYIDFKRFNDNNVKAKYYVKCSKILFFLRFNKSTFTARIYCKNYEFRMLDDNKMCIVTSKFIILQFKDTIKFTHYFDDRMAKWQSFGYSLTLVFFMFFTLIFGDNFFITNFSKLCSR